MSKNIIFYFTGTGNSLKVAKDISKYLGDSQVVSMTSFKDRALLHDAERIGFIFPVYGALPNFVHTFISEIQLPQNKEIYYFTIVTCGHFKWNSIAILNEKLQEKGITLHAGYSVKMVANAMFLYNINIPENLEKIHKKSQARINFIAPKIKQKEHNKIPPVNPLFFWQAQFVKSLPAMDTNFNVSSDCTGCAICGQVCPVKNIEIINGGPVFKHHCEQCLACMHHCPAKAINYQDKTQNRKRYINPDVTVGEIIKGNKYGSAD
jgi:ferredoxin